MTTPRAASSSTTTDAASSGDIDAAGTTTSGVNGASYGSSMPVKPVSSPARALRVEALRVACLAHLERRVDEHLDEREPRGLVQRARRARARRGTG